MAGPSSADPFHLELGPRYAGRSHFCREGLAYRCWAVCSRKFVKRQWGILPTPKGKNANGHLPFRLEMPIGVICQVLAVFGVNLFT